MKIFLSYGHDDNGWLVERIRDDLEKEINGQHEAWIDKAEIKGGDDWRRTITDGILDSERVLAFMSKHSVRAPGVCRDELAIALGHKGGNISTILLEPLRDDELPLSVSHIQRIDMSAWKGKKAAGDDVFEGWYREKFIEIQRVIRENARFSSEIETLAEKLQPMDNNPIIGGLLGQGFVGREWLLYEIENWRKTELNNRVYCLAAGPGFGKSAVAAWLAHANKIQVIAAHFCRYDQPNWSAPAAVIRNIAFQMATRLPDYRRYLLLEIERLEKAAPQFDFAAELNRLAQEGQSVTPEVLAQLAQQGKTPKTFSNMTPAELFEALIAGPALVGIDGGRERYLIVIDALDEAGGELIRYLADPKSSLPPWLALFVTSRPSDDGVQQFLTQLNARAVAPDDARNVDDAREWIQEWLKQRELTGMQQARIIEPLLEASEANFHYLRTFRQMVDNSGADAATLLDTPQAYPIGLSGLYLQFFERQFGRDESHLENYRQHQRPLMRLVMAARLHLPLALARRALNASKGSVESEDFVTQVLQPFGSIFPKVGEGEDQTIRPFHKSLRDWLSNPDFAGKYYVDPAAGHDTLGRLLWQEFIDKQAEPGTLTDYTRTELPYHLLAWSGEQLDTLGLDRSFWEKISPTAGQIASDLNDRVRWKEAETWQRLILRLDERLLGPDHPNTATTLNNLASLLKAQGDRAGARPLLERALSIREKVLGADHPDTATSLNNLAKLLHAMALLPQYQGDLADARPLYERALAIYEKVLGPDHPDTASCLNILAFLVKGQRDLAGAQTLYERALAIREKVLGPDHPETANILNKLAMLLIKQGDLAGARPLYERALAIYEKVRGPDHTDTASSLIELAMHLIKQSDLAGARPLYERALAIYEKVRGPDHPDTANSLNKLAMLLIEQGDLAGARPLYECALAIYEKVRGPDHPDTASSLNELAMLLIEQGDLAGARPFLERFLAICDDEYVDYKQLDSATSLNNLASLLHAQGDPSGAHLLLERALAIRKRILGPEDPDTLETRRRIAVCLRDEGHFDEALVIFQDVLAAQQRLHGTSLQNPLVVQSGIGKLYRLSGQFTKAREVLELALAEASQCLGVYHAVTQGLREELVLLPQTE